MQKLYAIILSLVVSLTYVGATMLSQSHHHHNGTICLKAAAMHNCNGDRTGSRTHGQQPCNHAASRQTCNHVAGEEPGCTCSGTTLVAPPQRTTAVNTPQQHPHDAIQPSITQKQAVAEAAAKTTIPRNSAPYTPPSLQAAVPLRAPPYTA